jgi:hypothetical protein
MRLVPIFLLIANLLVAASFLTDNPKAAGENESSRRQIHPERIRVVGTEREVVAAPSPKSTEEAREPPLECATWGSFPESRIAAAESRLAPLELGTRLSRTETSVASSYLVIIPPIAQRADLSRRVDELRRAGVTDQFVIIDGDLRNGISLGFFKSEEAANRHLAELKAKGVSDAVVSPRGSGNRMVTLHLKDLTVAERAELEAIAGEAPTAELKFQVCPPAAETG